jgi:transaldolase
VWLDNLESQGTAYDEQIAESAQSDATNYEIFERISVQDVQEAAGAFRAVYDDTDGGDRFVSIEVSPPNGMIKIAGTITLLFSVDHLSRVDTEVDARISPKHPALASANGGACRPTERAHSGSCGRVRIQNAKYPDTLYIDSLIGPQTITTLTLRRFDASVRSCYD